MNVAVLTQSFSERLSTSGVVALQGMLTIFLVLSLLWAAIEIMHRIIHREKPAKKVESEKPAQNAPVAEETVASAVTAPSNDEGAIVAAIIAAITAAREEQGDTSGFRVVSFKRTAPTHARRRF